MIRVAGFTAWEAIQDGWQGPPFDPFRLAEHLRIKIVPREDVVDARTVPAGSQGIHIEYNPNRPKPRVRYSIAHEIAHTFFPDCSDRVRYRASGMEAKAEDWEIEMLCNIGAAELLMPTGNFPDLRRTSLGIDEILNLRRQYEVSVECLALRYIKMTEQPVAVFVVSRGNPLTTDRYQIDYAVGSRTWPVRLNKGILLPKETLVRDCTAIGYTAKGQENWPQVGKVNTEAVGVPPYTASVFPRVVGLICPVAVKAKAALQIEYLIGDATALRGDGVRILAHVVNDRTPNWGAGFGRVVAETWPPLQENFRRWALSDRSHLKLGNIFVGKVEDDLFVIQMVCQHGYGASQKPRLRYAALKECLQQVMVKAREMEAAVHMPRIGAGYGGGSWGLIEQLIDENLCRFGVPVTVYSLPERRGPERPVGLFDRTSSGG
jgi:O-acetyl-ADP-ribose deacetylase (regulator of RNase III)